jgi:hypothetical protein
VFNLALYYHLKPYLPWRLRIAARRVLAKHRRRTHQHTWPINPAAGFAPPNWPGWPQEKKFSLLLTHDVEGPLGVTRCRQLMQLEKDLGFCSSFNFVPEGEYDVPRELREELQAGGFEVGVHDLHHDGKLYWTKEDFASKARRINRYLQEWGSTGFRSGFMLRNLEWLHELNIQYDASTFDTDPFEPEPDGVSTIFPFLKKNGSGPGYVELPYTLVQDSTLFISLQETSIDIWTKKLDWIVSRGGMAMLIVHPDYVNFSGGKCGPREFPAALYRKFLEYVKTKYAGQYWHTLPKNLVEWYVQTPGIQRAPLTRESSSAK